MVFVEPRPSVWQGAATGFIVSAFNHVAHEMQSPKDYYRNKPSTPNENDPLKDHFEEAVTLDNFRDEYKGMSASEIARDGGTDSLGLPKGPKKEYRYVINPKDGNVMDMRHVLVIGYGAYGRIGGLAVEIVQGIGFNKSAFNMQDFYSNTIGSYYYWNEVASRGFKQFTNMGKNFSIRFTNYIRNDFKPFKVQK